MAIALSHDTAADGTFSADGATHWNAAHVWSGLGTNQLLYSTGATTVANGGTFDGTTLSIAGGTLSSFLAGNGSATTPAYSFAGLTNAGIMNDAGSSGVSVAFVVGGAIRGGYTASGSVLPNSNYSFFWANAQAAINSHGANSLNFSANTASAAGAVTSRTEINKAVASIQDNSATAVFTVTIPNAAHSASIKVILTGSMGAGGAIGANESTESAEYDIDVTRTANLNAVATIGAVIGLPSAATVAGGDNVAVTAALSAIAGANNASNTFTVNVTIAKSGVNSGNNHTCLGYAKLMNANASGITIA